MIKIDFLKKKTKRSALCKLPISAHKLMIESGRYVTPKIAPQDRLCPVCNLNEVEDEYFVMWCPLLEQPRNTLILDLSDTYNVNDISDNDVLKISYEC